jgi:hypothetical protein
MVDNTKSVFENFNDFNLNQMDLDTILNSVQWKVLETVEAKPWVCAKNCKI